MKIDRFRIMGWLIPGLCIGTSAWFIYQQNDSLHRLSEQRNRSYIEAQQASQQKKLIEGLPLEKRYAAIPKSSTEEYQFVTFLKGRMVECGVALQSWSNQAIDLGKPGSKGPVAEQDPLLKGIQKIQTSLTLNGTYSNLRALVSVLENSDRLYTLSNLNWSRSTSGTSLSVDVSRYVLADKPVAPATPLGKVVAL